MRPYVLVFSGRIASGKSTLSQEIASALGWPHAGFGDYVRAAARCLGLDSEDRSVLQDVGEFLVRYPRPLCENVLARTGFVRGQGIVLDGLRHVEVLEQLRLVVAPLEVCLIYVAAPEAAIERRLREERITDGKTAGWDQHSTEIQVPTQLAGLANMVVRNEDMRPVTEIGREILEFLKRKDR